MNQHPSDFLELNTGPEPAPSPHASGVRVYADNDGTLHSLQSDGTDAPIGGAVFHGSYAFCSVAPSITGSWTVINFDSVLYDTDGYYNADTDGGGNGGFVIPDGLEGLYRAMVFAAFDDSGDGSELEIDLVQSVTLPGSTKIDGGESGNWHLGNTLVATHTLGFTNSFGVSPALPMASLSSTGGSYADVVYGRAKLSVPGPIDIFADSVPDTVFLTIERVGDIPGAS